MSGTNRVERDGATVVYDAQGDGPALVLLHNILCDRRVFDDAAPALAKSFRVIRIDFRGHGESGVPERAYTVEELAGDVEAVLDAEKVDRANLAGISLGASVALEFALSRPGRVRALALLGATARGDEGLAKARNAFLSPLVRWFGVRGPILSKAAGALFGKSFRYAEPAKFALWRGRIAALPPEAAYASLFAWRKRPRFVERLSAIQAPALVVAGTEDVACTVKEGEELAHGIPGARLERLVAGHVAAVERPSEVGNLLGHFFA